LGNNENISPLKRIREQKKLSLRKLSELTGISFSYLRKLEHGNHRLNSENLSILSKVLGVSMGYLLGESELKDEYIYLLWYENIHFFANDNQKEELRPWGVFKGILKNTFPEKDIEKIVMIRIKDDSMSPIIKNEEVILCYKLSNEIDYNTLNGSYIFKYKKDIFIRKLFFNKEKNLINAVAENKNYPSFNIDLSKQSQQFKVVGEVLIPVKQILKSNLLLSY